MVVEMAWALCLSSFPGLDVLTDLHSHETQKLHNAGPRLLHAFKGYKSVPASPTEPLVLCVYPNLLGALWSVKGLEPLTRGAASGESPQLAIRMFLLPFYSILLAG